MFSARGGEPKPPYRDLARFGDERLPLREVPGNLPAVRPQTQGSSRQAARGWSDEWREAPPNPEPKTARTSASEAAPVSDREVEKLTVDAPTEVERLRSHCEELLKLNTVLRQQQLDVTLGTYAGKFDHLLREFSQMRGFQQSLRQVVEMSSQSRKDLKELQQAVSPVSQMSQLMAAAVQDVKVSLREDVRQVVAEEVTTLREQLTRIHENSTRMVGLTLANRKDFEDHGIGLSGDKLDETLELSRESRELLKSNCSKLDATWDLVQKNKKLIDKNAETILSNKRSIEENRGFIESNKDLIKEEQEKAQAEALHALEKVQMLQNELKNQEHTLAEKARIEREIFESQRQQEAMEDEMTRLQEELQEGMKEEMDDLTGKVEEMLQAVGKLLDRIDQPQDGLTHQLRAVSEITRRGNLEINLNNGDVKLKRGIVFKKRNPGDQPDAQFDNDEFAKEILRDIADLWQMFSVPLVVEGHTKDIGGGSEQFWQEVANNRAGLCADVLETMGVDRTQLVAIGKPGKSGLNKAALVVHFDIFPDLH